MLSSLLLRLRRGLIVNNRGFTLVELIVVMAVASILMVGMVSMFDSMDRAVRRVDRIGQQQTTFTQVASFLDNRLSGADKTLGVAGANPPAINPVSMAGDQIVFTRGSKCYRLFYIESSKELRMAAASSCSTIEPTRGPNDPNGGSPPSDPVLDGSVASFVLASNISPTPPAGSSGSDPLRPFTFYDSNNNILTGSSGPSNTASRTSTNTFYNSSGNRSVVSAIKTTIYPEGSTYFAADNAEYSHTVFLAP